MIQKDVLNELQWEPSVQPNEIGVPVKEGVATLTGWVNSYLKKWDAERAAHRVRGVKAVVNDIEVKLASERTDHDIAADCVRALEMDVAIPNHKIRVTVSKGWVTLEGEVEWQFQKNDVERVVRRQAGVKGVTNLIRVNPQVTPTELKKKIEQALLRSAETDAERISVEVEGTSFSGEPCAPGRKRKRRSESRGRRRGLLRWTTESTSLCNPLVPMQ